jgi:hypothetical protein
MRAVPGTPVHIQYNTATTQLNTPCMQHQAAANTRQPSLHSYANASYTACTCAAHQRPLTCGCMLAHVSHKELHQAQLLHVRQLRPATAKPPAVLQKVTVQYNHPYNQAKTGTQLQLPQHRLRGAERQVHKAAQTTRAQLDRATNVYAPRPYIHEVSQGLT